MARKKGRKPFKPTAKMRADVERWTYSGISQDRIARRLKLSTPTLIKHFSEQLENGAGNRQIEAADFIYKSAKAGNVSAQKKWIELGCIAAAAKAAAESDQPKPTPETTSKAGKKALAAIAATTAGGDGTEWGDDLQVPDTPLN